MEIAKKLLVLLLFVSVLTGCKKEVVEEENPTIYGMWYSYLDFAELYDGQSKEEYHEEISEVIANMKSIGVNTIYLQAVAFTDALYPSTIYPQTTFLPDIDYDPIGIFLEKAHQNGMEVEIWINPLRSILVEEVSDDINPQIKKWIELNDERVRRVNGRYYLNPAYQEVRELVLSVIQEVLEMYEVDGIHFDDYFYPEGTEKKFDAYIYDVENQKEEIDLTTFRQRNITQLVREVHDLCKSYEKRFTISLAGNMENNLTMYYANPEEWIQEGLVDQLIPQIYWGYQHPTKPYERTLEEWLALTDGTNVQMLAGLAAYKIGTEDGFAGSAGTEWIDHSNMLARQTTTALQRGCVGVAYFRYGSLFHPSEEVRENVEKEIFNIQALNEEIVEN